MTTRADDGPEFDPGDPLAVLLRPTSDSLGPPPRRYEAIRRNAARRRLLRAAAGVGLTCAAAALIALPFHLATTSDGPAPPSVPLAPPPASSSPSERTSQPSPEQVTPRPGGSAEPDRSPSPAGPDTETAPGSRAPMSTPSRAPVEPSTVQREVDPADQAGPTPERPVGP
ncbi:hypothetical protein [Streptomyces sp. NPDC050428]|uniref:hypothetical protein n=1 Tax=Streptomyces sp. NPDC050428 TaxID=3155757 RepID=UPI0034165E97